MQMYTQGVCLCVCMSICRCFLRHNQFSAVFQPSRWCNVRVQPTTATSLGPGLKSCRSTLACLAVCFFLLIFSMVFSTYKHRLFFFEFHTKSHAQLPVRIWLTSKCIPKKPTGFISPRYPDDLTKISSENPSGYGGLTSFSRGRIHISTLISFFTSAKTHGPNRWIPVLVGVTDIGESSCFSVAVSPGPSSSARTLSNFSLTTSCIASFISFLLEVMKTTARVFFQPCTKKKKLADFSV